MDKKIYSCTEVAEVEIYLTKLSDINTLEAGGLTPLHLFSAFNTSVDVINLIIFHGGNVGKQSNSGLTPLHLASACNPSAEITRALIKAKASVDATSSNGLTPLHGAAAYNKNPEIVAELINFGADINSESNGLVTPLMAASANNSNPEIIKLLIAKGATVNPRDETVSTPLHVAAQMNKNPEAIRILFEGGAKLDAVNLEGHTPLHLAAAQNSNPEVVHQLLEAGASAGLANLDGKLPCDLALESNKKLITTDAYKTLRAVHHENWGTKKFFQMATLADVKRCLNDGAQPNLKISPNHLTPLHWAVRCSSDLLVIKALVEAGAEVNAVDRTGLIPLHWAVQNPYIPSEIVTYLAGQGGDLEAKVKNALLRPLDIAARSAEKAEVIETLIKLGSSPITDSDLDESVSIIHRAATNQRCPEQIIDVLVHNGVDPKALDKMNNSAIHSALKSNKIFLNTIKKLVEAGVDPNSQNSYGNTPLHKIVRMSCNNSALDFLIRSGADPYLENKKGKSPFDVASDSVKRNIKRLVNKISNIEVTKNGAHQKPPSDTHTNLEHDLFSQGLEAKS
ncbi:MAG: ankyrin repeat domain-containing protein [Rhodobacteraceae bacterium]|nr:ankyrin repeat domain-containing protein [Paracoccaceae bacterium]